MASNTNSPTTPPLSLRPKDAARALGIGQRKLWDLTVPRGPIPCLRIGVAVLYRVADLEAFLKRESERAGGAS